MKTTVIMCLTTALLAITPVLAQDKMDKDKMDKMDQSKMDQGKMDMKDKKPKKKAGDA